ncbi:MAG: DNA (cytosine-5-)-methyltransferase [Epulopiscium sp. Nele67-Bin004]|nr:MAG: DNA (cytosine-5-)-methyltransferase [Epulopiscium sp. Nele67-Bin004]
MKSIELFAGAGGLALGLEQAGFETIGLVEIDKSACATLRQNRPEWNVLETDITKLTDQNLEDIFNIKKGELDLLSGGYPCQAFSYAGVKKGLEDTRGTLFYHYAIFLEQLKPKMFLAENVRGLVSHNNGTTLQTMIDVFTNMGYTMKWKVLNAWDYGVAQKRERIFIIGVRNDLTDSITFNYPNAHQYKPVLRDILEDVPESAGSKYPEKKKSVLDLVPAGGCWRDLPDDIARDFMKGSYFLGGGRTGIARRLSWDEPSLTLTCSPAQGQTERCHPDETRPFTTREYARIQSFPDTWEFCGTTSNIYKQIGNAVPVNLGKCVGESIYNALQGKVIELTEKEQLLFV